MNNDQTKENDSCDQSIGEAPLLGCDGKIVQFDKKKRKDLASVRIEELKKTVEKKLGSLILSYLNAAKDDSLGAKYHFNRFNNEWKTYAIIKNKQQRDLTFGLDAFEKRVQYVIEMATKQLREQQEQQNDKENKQDTPEVSPD